MYEDVRSPILVQCYRSLAVDANTGRFACSPGYAESRHRCRDKSVRKRYRATEFAGVDLETVPSTPLI